MDLSNGKTQDFFSCIIKPKSSLININIKKTSIENSLVGPKHEGIELHLVLKVTWPPTKQGDQVIFGIKLLNHHNKNSLGQEC